MSYTEFDWWKNRCASYLLHEVDRDVEDPSLLGVRTLDATIQFEGKQVPFHTLWIRDNESYMKASCRLKETKLQDVKMWAIPSSLLLVITMSNIMSPAPGIFECKSCAAVYCICMLLAAMCNIYTIYASTQVFFFWNSTPPLQIIPIMFHEYSAHTYFYTPERYFLVSLFFLLFAFISLTFAIYDFYGLPYICIILLVLFMFPLAHIRWHWDRCISLWPGICKKK
jgi:hypothetical protein